MLDVGLFAVKSMKFSLTRFSKIQVYIYIYIYIYIKVEKVFVVYLKSNIQNFLIRLYFACNIPQFEMLIMPFFSDVWMALKIEVFMISRFVVFRCHGNIDFCKITIISNFSLNPLSGKDLESI